MWGFVTSLLLPHFYLCFCIWERAVSHVYFHFGIFHCVLPSGKTGLRWEVNKCMQQVALELWATHLIVEATAAFMLLKWPTESCHSVWKYTKNRGKCPVVEPVTHVSYLCSHNQPPLKSSQGITPGCLGFSCGCSSQWVPGRWHWQGRASTETGWNPPGPTGNSASETADIRELHAGWEGSSSLLVGKGWWGVCKGWAPEQPSGLSLYGWIRKRSGNPKIIHTLEQKRKEEDAGKGAYVQVRRGASNCAIYFEKCKTQVLIALFVSN